MDEETVKGRENRAEKERVSVCSLMCVAHSISASQRHRLLKGGMFCGFEAYTHLKSSSLSPHPLLKCVMEPPQMSRNKTQKSM